MMAVTSEQLLEFIERATTVAREIDASGQILSEVGPHLYGESLTGALKQVADLAAHESGLGFAQQQWEHQHPAATMPTFSGPRPVN